MFAKLRCKVFGHPMPGELGKFVSPIRELEPVADLPFLQTNCPRCGAIMRLHFLPGARGTNTPAHAVSILHWQSGISKQK